MLELLEDELEELDEDLEVDEPELLELEELEDELLEDSFLLR